MKSLEGNTLNYCLGPLADNVEHTFIALSHVMLNESLAVAFFTCTSITCVMGLFV